MMITWTVGWGCESFCGHGDWDEIMGDQKNSRGWSGMGTIYFRVSPSSPHCLSGLDVTCRSRGLCPLARALLINTRTNTPTFGRD